MNKKIIFILSLGLFCLLSGCVSNPPKVFTPLELQAMQSRNYKNSKDIIFASVISVFQDMGYAITNADKATGLIYAESSANTVNKFFVVVTEQTKATAFIEKIADKVQVRLNFVNSNHSSSGYGQTNRQDNPVLDTQIYQNAFNKIENAIFLRSNN